MFFVINRSITDWSLSLAAKNQIRCFPKGKHKGLGPDQCRRKWSPVLCFPLFTLELHLEHDYSPSRRFLLELLQNTLASSRARPWIEDTSTRPLMVRKVHYRQHRCSGLPAVTVTTTLDLYQEIAATSGGCTGYDELPATSDGCTG